MKNSGVWILWLSFNIVFLLSTRNPIYLFIVLIGLFLAGNRLVRKSQNPLWLRNNLRFLITMVLLSTVINALFTHTGRTILFSLPQNWLLIGGNITVESIFYGAVNGMVIGALYLLFNVINTALSIKQITHLIPKVFHPIAMTVTIALTFFPSIQHRIREIKEAQMIRGNRMKKLSDWLPIVLPLLITSLEKAIMLAESMTARGFQTLPVKNSNLTIIGLIAAVFTVFSGWILHLYSYPTWISRSCYIVGVLVIISLLLISTRQSNVTSYYKEVWQSKDIVIGVFLTSSLIAFVFLVSNSRISSLSHSPYPVLNYPPFQLSGLFFSMFSLFPLLFTDYD